MYVILFDKHVQYGKKSIKTEIMSTLIENGAYIDALDKDGRTALCHAFQRDNDNDDILVLLLDSGASVHKYLTNLRESKTPLISVCNNFLDVKILIEVLYGKEDINENDDAVHTSFLFQLYCHHVELAILLIFDHSDLVKKNNKLIFQLIFNTFQVVNRFMLKKYFIALS
ncbi:uncharacterized protein LOC142333970 [Lycorma delicatula]|uniref:uncharacterized protein LOC142333970 n=1 Tax=Lycorma delicatula TaxID=130591 RepID=UPI003F50F375